MVTGTMEIRRRVATLLRSSARVRFINLTNKCAVPQLPIHARVSFVTARRAYATPGRPRTTVGETRRPATKRTTTKASSTTKKTTKSKKAKKPKKAAAPKRVRKAPSERQLKLKAAKKEKGEIDSLKTAALLDAPRVARIGPYLLFYVEKSKNQPVTPDGTRAIAAEYKTLSPLEKQHYVTQSAEAKEKALAAQTRFIDQHTPEQIRQANVARAALRRKLPKQKRRYPALQDQRSVKRPTSSYIYFSQDQYASGSNDGSSVANRAATLKRQWETLSASDKQRYADLASQDRSRYIQEFTNVYGHSPPGSSRASSPRASP